jgi:hypothetical protein
MKISPVSAFLALLAFAAGPLCGVDAFYVSSGVSTASSSQLHLIPPMKIVEMMSKSGETASVYEKHIQKTYGYVKRN